MLATVTLTGRLGTRPSCSVTQSGIPYARFRLAHTPRLRRGDEWVDGETIWCTVRCYGQLARGVSPLHSGDPVVVVGQWRYEEWSDAEGVHHSNHVLLADAVGPDLRLCSVQVMGPIRDERVPDRDTVPTQETGEATEKSESGGPGEPGGSGEPGGPVVTADTGGDTDAAASAEPPF